MTLEEIIVRQANRIAELEIQLADETEMKKIYQNGEQRAILAHDNLIEKFELDAFKYNGMPF